MNPIECGYNVLKSAIRASYATSLAGQVQRPWRRAELQDMAIKVARSFTKRHYEGWFKERAGVDAFVKYYPEIHL